MSILNATTTSGIVLTGDTTGNLTIQSAGSNVANFTSSGPIQFFESGSEIARFDTTGSFLLGSTTQQGQTAKSLILNNSSSNVGLLAQSSASGDVGTDGIRVGKYDNNTTTSQIFMRFTINNAGNGSGSITANGANACAFGSFSDARLKTNIVPLTSQLTNILALKPCSFDYLDGSGSNIGFIAQDMQSVYSDAVGEDEQTKMLTVTGWSKTEARLVKAIQELKTLVDTQATQIAELQAKVGA